MIEYLSILEILVVVSATLQIGTILFASYVYWVINRNDKRIWVWFLIPSIIILGRRILAISRYSLNIPTLEMEYLLTIIVSSCWIFYIYMFLARIISGEKKNNPDNWCKSEPRE
jgi:hypothetical protein